VGPTPLVTFCVAQLQDQVGSIPRRRSAPPVAVACRSVLPSPPSPGEYLPTAPDPESSADADGCAGFGLVHRQPPRLAPTRGVEERVVIRFGDEAIREEEGRWGLASGRSGPNRSASVGAAMADLGHKNLWVQHPLVNGFSHSRRRRLPSAATIYKSHLVHQLGFFKLIHLFSIERSNLFEFNLLPCSPARA